MPAKVRKGAHTDDPQNRSVDGAHKGVTASPELAEIIGEGSMKRTEVVSRVWDYVRKHNLQNPDNRREIIADERLKKVFGRDRATMFEMNRLVFAHLK
ncbi:MAG: SWIB/MDM2 domain-containing protein [Sphingomonadaceae bacterium]|nr:SWIB/MDM2 domain-containing protein [Sphingomonadaceae bacterium]